MRRIGVLGIAALAAWPAFSQGSGGAADAARQPQSPLPGQTAAPADEGGLADIVVTAQKRSESVQRVPITISAFTAKELVLGGLRDVEQIAKLTPGLYVGKFDTLRPQVYLRGIGSRVFDPGSEGSVGIFADESYLGRFSGSLTDILDADRVEVLKGPQGTLYGRNTIGGAINIVSRAPTREWEGYAEAVGGNYGLYDIRGAVGGPLSDAVRFRIAGRVEHRDGYSLNTASGRHGNGDDGKQLRGRLAADLAPDLTVDLIGDYDHARLPGLFQKSTGTRQFLQAAASPSYTPNPDRYAEAYNDDGYSRRTVADGIGKVAWRTGEVQVNSITSYRDSRVGQEYDLDATPRNIWTFSYREHSRQFSQELRLSSAPGSGLFDGRVEWVLGGYFYREHSIRTDHFDMGPDSIFAFRQPAVEHNSYATDIVTRSYAAFGQATWHITDKLGLTAGGRYTDDRKTATIATTTDSVAPPSYYPGFTVRPRKSWHSVDPKFTLDYRFTLRVLGYATVSRGFKGGGFQYNATNATLAARIFNPEHAWTYEVGLKSQFLDNRVQLNIAGFRYNYRNLQLPLFVALPGGTGSNVISNAAKSTIKGIEATTAVLLAPGLTLNGGVSHLDAHYDRYVTGTADYSGDRMIRSPKWQANASLTWEHPFTDHLKFRARGDYSYTARIFFEADEGARPFTSQGPVSLGNLRAGIAQIKDKWAIEGWVNNVGDKRYVTTVFSVPVSVLQIWSLPRTYGITTRVVF